MTTGHLIAIFLAVLLLFTPAWRPKRRARDKLDETVSRVGTDWTGRMLAEGVIWVGGIGSGKTSCSAPMLVDMLRAGYSAALYTVKVEERDHLERLVKLAGREKDLVRIGRDYGNFIDAVAYTYAATQSIESVAQLFESLMTAIEGKGDAKADAKSRFFERSGLIAVRHATLIIAAIDPKKLSFGTIGQLIVEAPKLKFLNNPGSKEERAQVEAFKQGVFWHAATLADRAIKDGRVRPDLVTDVENAIRYFLGPWSDLANDTRSSIVASVTAMSELFSFNPLRSLLADRTTITPEMLWEGKGKVFLFTDPVHKGIDCKLFQLAWKFLIQKAAERRSVVGDHVKVVQWMDEAHQLVLSAGRFDASFQAISRSKGFVNVLLLQSFAQLRSILGSEEEANDYLSNIRNRVVMAVDEPWTQKWLSDMCGKEVKFLPSPEHRHHRDGGIDWWGADEDLPQWHSTMDYAIQPHEWGVLQKAKPGQLGEAILYLGGSPIGGKSYARVWLKQLLA